MNTLKYIAKRLIFFLCALAMFCGYTIPVASQLIQPMPSGAIEAPSIHPTMTKTSSADLDPGDGHVVEPKLEEEEKREPETQSSPSQPIQIPYVSADTEETRHLIWDLLCEQGFSPIETAAIMGNMAQETRFLPQYACGYSGGYYGLCMWSVVYHSKLFEVEGEHQPYPSIARQCEYLWQTFRFTDTSSVEAATRNFCYKYERPSLPHIEARVVFAQQIYAEFWE